MSRTRKLKFADRITSPQGRGHPMLVGSVTTEGTGWRVTLIHLGSERLGQEQAMLLPATAPHDGAVGSLFRACGMGIGPDTEADPAELEGKIVNAMFYTSTSGASGIIGFEPCQETRHEPDA